MFIPTSNFSIPSRRAAVVLSRIFRRRGGLLSAAGALRAWLLSLIALALGLLASQPMSAVTFTFTKIVTFDDAVPGGVGTFTSLSTIANMGGGQVASSGSDSAGATFVFTGDSASLTTIATESTTIPPGGLGTFNTLGAPTATASIVVFSEFGGPADGLYVSNGGVLSPFAIEGVTLIPGGGGATFGSISGDTTSSGTSIAFTEAAISGNDPVGFYADFGSGLEVIADLNTLVPGTSETFWSASDS